MRFPLAAMAAALAFAGAPAFAADSNKGAAQKTVAVQIPLGLLPLEWPKDNSYSADKVALGRLLYFDKRLSKDDTVSCASCHSPEHGYTDGAPNSEGIHGRHGNR
jgi:cytochrome c peroxidase